MKAEQLDLFGNAGFEEVQECPLKGRKVVVTGDFECGRQALRSTLLKLGAAEVKSDKPARGTHFMVVGDNPQVEAMNFLRLYRHDGYNIRILTALDIDRIKAGEYATYKMPEEMVKDLHLTREDVWFEMPDIASLKNERVSSPLDLHSKQAPLYGLEIFVHGSIMTEHPELAQSIGNLGAYANNCMDDDTDAIVIPKSMPRDICREVESFYNNSRSTAFNTPFIILEDLLGYINGIEEHE